MEVEKILSGYCRSQDQARTVLAELFDGQWDWNCDYPACAHSISCPIAAQLAALQEEYK